MSVLYAVIGGSGLYNLGEDFVEQSRGFVDTPYGTTSAEIIRGSWQNQTVIFLARHGESHRIDPHQINYRANLYALKRQGVTHVIAVNAVGGISPNYGPETIALPDQIIDYSWGRAHSFSDGDNAEVQHIDFTYPYSSEIRRLIMASAEEAKIELQTSGVYGCTNGPRLETKAEIIRMSRDGSDMIGMTGMPEAALARELGIEYASIALVVNWCAGIAGPKTHQREHAGAEEAEGENAEAPITMEQILRVLEQGLQPVKQLILSTLKRANQ